MAAIVEVECNAYLNASSGGTTYTNPTTPMKIALMTTSPTQTSAGTEFTGGAGPYARQTIVYASAATHAIASNTGQTFSGMPAGSLQSVNEYDSAGTPIRRWFGDITSAPKTINAGDTVSIASGAVTKTLT